jgi:hypothetical protein
LKIGQVHPNIPSLLPASVKHFPVGFRLLMLCKSLLQLEEFFVRRKRPRPGNRRGVFYFGCSGVPLLLDYVENVFSAPRLL